MQKGDKVVAHRDHTIHPLVRGKNGVVNGKGPKDGWWDVLFEGEHVPITVDESALDMVEEKKPDPPAE